MKDKTKQNHIIEKMFNRYTKKEEGVTLVALIVTIVIMVIIAAVSIVVVYNSRIVEHAINGTQDYAMKSIEENKIMNGTESLIDSTVNRINDIVGGKITGGSEPEESKPEEPIVKPLVTTLTEIQISKIEAEDKLGNAITVPEGFKVRTDLGETVEKGIVIEDEEGNQFVWVPVSNINHDGTGKIKKEDGTEVEITLGRYTFNTSTGAVNTAEGTYQYAVNYEDETVLDTYFKELKEYRESNRKNDLTGTNTTAKDLAGFIASVNSNYGYYMARYEASYGSGSSIADWKPLSKVSTSNSDSSMNYTVGTLWNCSVTEPDAAQICQNMYSGNVKSDLVNSYAWDTAMIFIQEMEDSDYSIKKDGNGSLRNTGETGDKVCNIFDMKGNLREITTEFSSYTSGSSPWQYVGRGANCRNDDNYTSGRYSGSIMVGMWLIGFRVLLYV